VGSGLNGYSSDLAETQLFLPIPYRGARANQNQSGTDVATGGAAGVCVLVVGASDMFKLAIVILPVFLAAATVAHAADPIVTDGDKYRVILENERVRVLAYDDKPGEKTHQHEHRDFVLYALAPFKRKLTFADGKSSTREFKTGDAIWMKRQIHIGENVGTTDTHVLIVELKEPPPPSAERSDSSFR
jgi:quercetin dioxygenase-like cupin family protein